MFISPVFAIGMDQTRFHVLYIQASVNGTKYTFVLYLPLIKVIKMLLL